MRKFKGFTLVELIIVMAIMAIIMAALMNMMKPIRETYVDSTYYESERNTQSGIATYITESVRYATNLGVYTDDKVNSGATPESINGIREAIDLFKTETGITDESKINVITIDNTTAYMYNNTKYYGRLVRTKKPGSTGKYTSDAADAGSDEARLALGDAYYGDNTYSISLKTTDTGVEVQVSSILSDSLKTKTKNGGDALTLNAKDSDGNSIYDAAGNPGKLVTTVAEVSCPNVAGGMVKTSGSFSKNYAGSTTTSGKNTYIIFTLPE